MNPYEEKAIKERIEYLKSPAAVTMTEIVGTAIFLVAMAGFTISFIGPWLYSRIGGYAWFVLLLVVSLLLVGVPVGMRVREISKLEKQRNALEL